MASVGTKYQSGMDTAEAAKHIRADIKAAQRSGTLPASLKVGVRISRYSGGSSISMRIEEAPLQIHASEFVAFEVKTAGRVFFEGQRFTARARALLDALRAIGEEYRRNESDPSSDYYNTNFHLSVDFASSLASEDMAMQREYHAALAV